MGHGLTRMTSSTRIGILIVLLCGFSSSVFAQTNCVETAHEVKPELSAEAQRELEAKLNEARGRPSRKINSPLTISSGSAGALLTSGGIKMRLGFLARA